MSLPKFFEDPNVVDVELENTVNEQIGLSAGTDLKPFEKVRASEKNISKAALKQILLRGVLAYYNSGDLKLNPITAEVFKQTKEEEYKKAEEVKAAKLAETTVLATIVVDKDTNPITDEEVGGGNDDMSKEQSLAKVVKILPPNAPVEPPGAKVSKAPPGADTTKHSNNSKGKGGKKPEIPPAPEVKPDSGKA